MDKTDIMEFLTSEFEDNELEITKDAHEFIENVSKYIADIIDETDFDDEEDIEDSLEYIVTSLEYRNDLKQFMPSDTACDQIMEKAMDQNEDFYREYADDFSGKFCFIAIWESTILQNLDDYIREELE